jgi:uncharacterized membrane protein YdfJ with MMPL/SSD domain
VDAVNIVFVRELTGRAGVAPAAAHRRAGHRRAAADRTTVLVGGQTAELVDTKHAIGVRLPVAAAWIVLTMLLVLFLFTGSVLQPLRSLLLNPLTLTATLGLMVWIFQDGQLSSVVHFPPLPLDTSMLVPKAPMASGAPGGRHCAGSTAGSP